MSWQKYSLNGLCIAISSVISVAVSFSIAQSPAMIIKLPLIRYIYNIYILNIYIYALIGGLQYLHKCSQCFASHNFQAAYKELVLSIITGIISEK